MSEKKPSELRALLAKATPGPWYPSNDPESGAVCHIDAETKLPWAHVDCLESRADADLIVAMHNMLPPLLDATAIVIAIGKQPAPTNDYPMSTKGRWGCTLCSGMAEDENAIVHDESCAWKRCRDFVIKYGQSSTIPNVIGDEK